MHIAKAVFMAGAAAAVLFGMSGMAASANPQTHVMTVQLPGGSVEQIQYTGNIAPKVVVRPDWSPLEIGWPVAVFGPGSTFSQLERISATIDRQMDVMLRNAEALASDPGLVAEIDAAKLPPDSQGYSFVSTMSGNGVCGKSVEITSRGDGQKPRVVSKTWGDCGHGHNGAGVNSITPSSREPSDVREIRYDRGAPAPRVQEASMY